MEIIEQFQNHHKEYVLDYEELRKLVGIPEEIDHVWIEHGKQIGIATKWVKVTTKEKDSHGK